MYDVTKLTPSSVTKVTNCVISITHLLARNQCTYNEAEQLIELLKTEIDYSRERREYATYADYFAGKKTACMDNVVIAPIGRVDENLNPIKKS